MSQRPLGRSIWVHRRAATGAAWAMASGLIMACSSSPAPEADARSPDGSVELPAPSDLAPLEVVTGADRSSEETSSPGDTPAADGSDAEDGSGVEVAADVAHDGADPTDGGRDVGPGTATLVPPPIGGGTLLVLEDGKTAVASDPDRDTIFVVDLAMPRLLATVVLQPGDEPGRLVQGSGDVVYVVLRRGGAVLALDVHSGTISMRQPVCAAPRGIAYEAANASVHVACAGGELISLSAPSLAEIRRRKLQADLRDVVVSGDHLYVSVFRRVAVMRVKTSDLSLIDSRVPPGSSVANQRNVPSDPPVFTPMEAYRPVIGWRMRPLSGGGAVLLHQESSNAVLSTVRGVGYRPEPRQRCLGTVNAALAEFHDDAAPTSSSSQFTFGAAAVDFDITADRRWFAVIFVGGRLLSGGSPITMGALADLQQGDGNCLGELPSPPDPIKFRQPTGDPVAVAFDGQGRLVAQSREPAQIEILTHGGGTIALSNLSRADVGHRLFHTVTPGGLSCVSCHPEGGDDGRIWRFRNIGGIRTANLLGGILATAPFQSDALLRNMSDVMDRVYGGYMQGPPVSQAEVAAMEKWIDGLARIPTSPPSDPAAVARGRGLFESPGVGCAVCHPAPLLTDNQTRTGVRSAGGVGFQVPSLRGLSNRGPYLHDGCAADLPSVFTLYCDGATHGKTAQLLPAEMADLISYLETL